MSWHPAVPTPPPTVVGTVRARFGDLGAATRAECALRSAGFREGEVRVKGQRVTTGLQEVPRRPRRHRSPRRLRINVGVAVLAGVLVGPPVGASTAMVALGESTAAMWLGALLGVTAIAGTGSVWAWAEHHQLIAWSTLPSRVEGVLVVVAANGSALERAERLLRAAPDVRDVASGWGGVEVLTVT